MIFYIDFHLSYCKKKNKEKLYFRKISAGNNFGQLRILDGLIFGQKKIRNFVPTKFLGFNVFLFCATLNIFSQHESLFWRHMIFFVDTPYCVVTHIILVGNLTFMWNIFLVDTTSFLYNTTFFWATRTECELKEWWIQRNRCVAINKTWKRHAVLHLLAWLLSLLKSNANT